MSDPRLERFRRDNGEFGNQPHSEPQGDFAAVKRAEAADRSIKLIGNIERTLREHDDLVSADSFHGEVFRGYIAHAFTALAHEISHNLEDVELTNDRATRRGLKAVRNIAAHNYADFDYDIARGLVRNGTLDQLRADLEKLL